MSDRTFPEVLNQKPFLLDMTPDEELPLRILKAYRRDCNAKWASSGPGNTHQIYDAMNEAQDQRASILDQAIKVLEKFGPRNIKVDQKTWEDHVEISVSSTGSGL